MPLLADKLTITVSPYHGHANISPSFARYTGLEEGFPSHDPAYLERMVMAGYEDCNSWLRIQHSNKVLSKRFFNDELI